jgi:hypothetical protein
MADPLESGIAPMFFRAPRYTAMIRVFYCPECDSNLVLPHSQDEDGTIYECCNCGEHFYPDNYEKLYEEIEGND